MLRLLIFKDPNLCQWQHGPKFYARSNMVKGFTPCYGDVWRRGQLYKLSTSADDKVGWSATCSGSLVGVPGTHKMRGGRVGHTAGWDTKEEKILYLEYWSPTCSLAVYWLRPIYFQVYTQSRVILQKFMVPQIIKFPTFYGTQRFTALCKWACHWSLSSARWNKITCYHKTYNLAIPLSAG
jgi:hypothetical protein